MNVYSAYGLNIHSALPLPELLPVEAAADVVIEYGRLEMPRFEDTYYIIRVDGDVISLFMEDVGAVQVQAGCKIVIDPLPGAEELGFRFLVTGMAMGLLLYQRGVFTLHASAVAMGDKAIGFVGAKGMGKSTTAAALFQQGYPIVTDDLLVLDLAGRQDEVFVRPGYPHLKLWPESIAATLKDNPDTLSRVHPEATKRVRLTTQGFSKTFLPLRCIYVLDSGPGSEMTITSLPDGEACIELIRHSYAVRMLQQRGATPDHLQQCASLIKRVPIRRLNRANTLSRLEDLVACIESDVARLDAPPPPVSTRTRSEAAV